MSTVWSNREIDFAFDQCAIGDEEYAIRSMDDTFDDIWLSEGDALEMAREIIRSIENKRKVNR